MPDEDRTRFNRGLFLQDFTMPDGPGRKIKPSTWNKFVRQVATALSTAMVTKVAGGALEQSAAGTVIIPGAAAGSAGGSSPQPFQMLSFLPVGGDLTGASGYKLTMQPGTVNATEFPLVSGSTMWQLIATTVGMVTTYAYPTLTVMTGNQVYIQGTVTAGILTAINIYSGTPPAEDDSTTFFLLGACDPSTGAWLQIATGNRTYTASAAYFEAGSRLIAHKWD